MSQAKCRICGQAGLQDYSVREMMLGTGVAFPYELCPACGSLQIAAMPADMSEHYPGAYYSMEKLVLEPVEGLAAGLRRWRLRWYLATPLNLEWLWRLALGGHEFFPWLKEARLRSRARVLDVGSGSGYFLRGLYHFGFHHLTGLDPFLPMEVDYAPGFKILRQDVSEHQGSYDLITLNHSLEHVADPVAALKECRRLLEPGGKVLVRVPVMGQQAWDLYGVDWVQIDAPRHFHVPSEKGMELLAEQAGFKVTKIVYDSHALQFWGSEQYQRGISLWAPSSVIVNRKASGYSRFKLLWYRVKSMVLNNDGQGDQACFYLEAQGLAGSSTSRNP